MRWYLTYRLSYRDLVEMMAERGIILSHSTILRWVQRYVPEFEKRWGRYCPSRAFILEDGRDLRFGAWRCSLSVPGGR